MEGSKNSTSTATATPTPTAINNKNKTMDHGAAKKKRGSMNLIRVALFMLRRQSNGKSKNLQVDVASKGMWKRLVGSIRLMHLQHNQSPRATIEAVPVHEINIEQFEDVLPQPMSPSSSSCDECSSSQYASAVNLQELDKSGDCHDYDDYGGDMMIDEKADEFIAQFYEQMKLQRADSINRYNEMIAMGLY